MGYSQTIVSVIVLLLAQILPLIGVSIGGDQLTNVVSTLATIIAGVWIWVRRYQAGGVGIFGARK